MARTKLIDLANPAKLREEWGLIYRRAGRTKARDIIDFQASLDANIADISNQLRAGYQFATLKPVIINKSGGKIRVICVPSVRDRLVQRTVTSFLSQRELRLGIFNPVSYGFITSKHGPRGVEAARDRALELRTSFPFAYKTDISKFFDNIPRDELDAQIRTTVRAQSIIPLLTAAMNCEIDDSNAALNRQIRSAGIRRGIGVRQGMPLSPIFANILLRDFDRAMIRRQLPIVRYADDIIAFGASRAECESHGALIADELSKLKLTIPVLGEGSKTQICEPSEPVEFLGMCIFPSDTGTFNLILTHDQLNFIYEKICELRDVDKLMREKKTFADLQRMVDAKIGGYRAAFRCAQNFVELHAKLTAARGKVVEGALRKILGPHLDKLKPDERQFLGL